MCLPSRSTTEAHECRGSNRSTSAAGGTRTACIPAFLEASQQHDCSIMRLSTPTSTSLHISSFSLQSQVLEEELLDGGHIVVSVKPDNKFNKSFASYVLVDYGATGYTFIDEEFACNHNLPLYKLKTPHLLEVINSRPIKSRLITHLTQLRMSIDGHQKDIPMFVTKLGYYPIVLGLP